jgi:hypothetical protein
MRWDRLFDDLEGQVEGDQVRARAAEVADRVRRERAQVDLHTRLLAHVGAGELALRLPGRPPRVLTGVVVDVGPDWALVEPARNRQVLVALHAVRGLEGLGRGARTPSVVARRIGLGSALRAVSRDRAAVELTDLDGELHTGTIDAVGADHVELAEHAADAPRRRANVVRQVVVPFGALGSVRRLG